MSRPDRQEALQNPAWSIPYVDQPSDFWQSIADEFGRDIREVYFPLPATIVGSGRPELGRKHLDEFLRVAPMRKAALVNAVTLPGPVDTVAPRIIEEIRRLNAEFDLSGVTVANLQVAERLRDAIPRLSITASVLMDIGDPNQALMINGVCDVLVPSARVMRNLPSLAALKQAFHGSIRLLVNEACLVGCPYRLQHFHEMATGVLEPLSLCRIC